MELTHTFAVPTTVEETWAHFQDIAAVAECFPGAQVTSAEGETFEGTVKVKLGPIALVYQGSGTFRERDDAAHRFVVEAKGRDKRGNGTAGATATLSMKEAAGGTEVEVLTDLSVTGKPAQFGRGVMQDVSDKLLGQFVDCLEHRLAAGEPEPADQDAGPASVPVGAALESAEADAGGPATDSDAGPASAPGPAQGAVPAPGTAAGAEGAPGVVREVGAHRARTDDAIDLGTTVLPVLLKTYGRQVAIAVAALVGLAILVRILRR